MRSSSIFFFARFKSRRCAASVMICVREDAAAAATWQQQLGAERVVQGPDGDRTPEHSACVNGRQREERLLLLLQSLSVYPSVCSDE